MRSATRDSQVRVATLDTSTTAREFHRVLSSPLPSQVRVQGRLPEFAGTDRFAAIDEQPDELALLVSHLDDT